MPVTVRMGSRGPAVAQLQTQLNPRLPKIKPPLVVDGIFGPKTHAAVLEFQHSMGLVADGIVGPLTWQALQAPAPLPLPPVPSTGLECGNGNPANQNLVMAMAGTASPRSSFASTRSAFAGTRTMSFIGSGVPASIPGLTRLAGSAKESTARNVYGDSLDYENIFMSPISGAQDRPFTAVLPVSVFPTTFVQVMNLGPEPSDNTLIHELAHCWQSQHHPDPKAFMSACVKCQAAALARNGVEGVIDPTIRTDKNFPVNYPFSAYAYVPLKPFGTYGGEQIAQMVHRGVTPIRTAVKGAAKNAIVADNVTSLTVVTFEDRRDQMVFI